MSDFKNDMINIQALISEAFSNSGSLVPFANGEAHNPERLCRVMDSTLQKLELAVVDARRLADRHRPIITDMKSKNNPPAWKKVSGEIDVTEHGWLHITLNSLLPHCRFGTPAYLTDTIGRLLNDYEQQGRKLPFFKKAFLIIDEHSTAEKRQVYDSDNKGWKAIPNALKGRVIEDDDQFSLSVALLARRSNITACHIHVLEIHDVINYFYLRGLDG